jgi:hypothetical protein
LAKAGNVNDATAIVEVRIHEVFSESFEHG